VESEETDKESAISPRVNEFLILRYIDLIEVFRNGTSMISLIIPPKDQVSRVNKMLADEYGTASNIKSRVNRFVVLMPL
jgi:peptide chain release factor subunit 1